MLTSLRNHCFWLVDQLNNGVIRSAFEDIEWFDQTDFDAPKAARMRQQRVASLLDHCRQTVPFYRSKGLAGVGLSDFPVVSKSIMRQDQDAFISDRFKGKRHTLMSTSGSSGTPFTAKQDPIKKKRVYAEVIYYSSKVNYFVGQRLIFLRSLSPRTRKSFFRMFLQNERLVDVSNISDEGIMDMLDTIQSNIVPKTTIVTYASTLDRIASLSERKPLLLDHYDFRDIVGVISGAEMLADATRQVIQELFGCRCCSRYSNQENGILCQDDEINNAFITNSSSYHFEILTLNADDPVTNPGEIGRVVVTDLFNYYMPFARYDTGDLGRIEEIRVNGIKKLAIVDFSGRVMDMITNSRGSIVSPHKISVLFSAHPSIKQYQFAQKSTASYRLRIVSEDQTVHTDLKDQLLPVLGLDARVEHEYCETIPPGRSGKMKYITNLVSSDS